MPYPANQHLYVVPSGRKLVLIPGNIDLLHRPTVHNADGSTSSVFSYSFTMDGGKAILLPGVIRNANGRWVTSRDKTAVLNAYKRTGQFLGIFRNVKDAERYSILLHNEQANLYVPPKRTTSAHEALLYHNLTG